MKLGIYSGTFDPIHEGHVLFAQVVIEQFGLDEVVFIPEESPRHKTGVTDVFERRRMAQLAVSEYPELTVFDAAIEPTHTIRGVLEAVHTQYPDDEYYIVMGSDVFENVGSWGERDDEDGSVQDVKDAVAFVVGLTDAAELSKLDAMAEELGIQARFIENPLAKLASRTIREKLKNGEEAKGLNDIVKRYITETNLYS